MGLADRVIVCSGYYRIFAACESTLESLREGWDSREDCMVKRRALLGADLSHILHMRLRDVIGALGRVAWMRLCQGVPGYICAEDLNLRGTLLFSYLHLLARSPLSLSTSRSPRIQNPSASSAMARCLVAPQQSSLLGLVSRLQPLELSVDVSSISYLRLHMVRLPLSALQQIVTRGSAFTEPV